uniref:Uncharacterized protein n=1 Tax=viral metagenome TaxID=1070528 RepID=A0A6C0KZZ2_9ZZZZ|tara:strand:- start:7726 stop:8130 length:405 start_codon:yes stop_codon:yes gene_type:complete
MKTKEDLQKKVDELRTQLQHHKEQYIKHKKNLMDEIDGFRNKVSKDNVDSGHEHHLLQKTDFPDIIYTILKENGGSMNIMEISKEIWRRHNHSLSMNDMFYTWQYDFRWGATKLRKQNRMKGSTESPKGIWELK